MHDFLSEERQAGWSGEAAEVGRLAWTALTELAARGSQSRAAQRPLLKRLIDSAASGDRTEFDHVVGELIRARISPRAIVDSYVPDAARQLGEDWVSDRRSFADVTIGCAALQSLVRSMSADCPGVAPSDAVADLLLVVPMGEDHTLGAVVAASWLRRGGASVTLLLQPTPADLCKIAAVGGFDAVMLSWANAEGLESVAAIVKQVRAAVTRPTLIAIGGSVIGRVGAIETATGSDLATNDLQLMLSRVIGTRTASAQVMPSRWS